MKNERSKEGGVLNGGTPNEGTPNFFRHKEQIRVIIGHNSKVTWGRLVSIERLIAWVASRGAAGLVKSGKKTKAKNTSFTTARSYALAA